jgi:hypothetical protein
VLDGPATAPSLFFCVHTQNANILPLSRCTLLDGHNQTNGLHNTTTLFSCHWFSASGFLHQHPWHQLLGLPGCSWQTSLLCWIQHVCAFLTLALGLSLFFLFFIVSPVHDTPFSGSLAFCCLFIGLIPGFGRTLRCCHRFPQLRLGLAFTHFFSTLLLGRDSMGSG